MIYKYLKVIFFGLFVISIFTPKLLIANQKISNSNTSIERRDAALKIDETLILENILDPYKYELGPGDKLGLSITTSSDIAYFMEPYITIITPTGDIWIPDVGSINIAGETIKNAEKNIINFIRKNKLKSAEVSMALLDVRKYKIQVIGAVLNPQFVNVSSIDRLIVAIEKAGGLHKSADEENINIIRKDNTEINCSLKSYNFNGDLDNNPILKNGDIISVPFLDTKMINNTTMTYKNNQIFVTGFVVNPGGHVYIPGYNAIEYIAMSGGISINGDLNSILIYRDGKLISYNDTLLLLPGDEVNVKSNLKHKIFGDMSIIQTMTALMTLFLTYAAATN